MKSGFTLVEVMLANTILVMLVAGFANVTEKTLEQMQLREQKTALASQLDNWTLSKLNATLIPGSYQEIVTLSGENAELHWQVSLVEPTLNAIFFQLKSSDAVPKILAEWRTAQRKP
jgi:prepilin-type N-terminal cleavage/methylation domain-containing protein